MRVLGVISFLLGLCFFSYGLDISFSYDYLVISTIAREQVFCDYNGSEHLLSELVWTGGDIGLAGLSSEFVFSNIVLSVDTAFSIKDFGSSYMEDYDFLNLGYDYATHYSVHDVIQDLYFEIVGLVGWDFSLGDAHVVPSIGWFYLHRKWSAYDGYAIYPVSPGEPYDPSSGTGSAYPYYTGSGTKTSLSGLVIDYEQEFMSPVFALSFSSGRLSIFSFSIEPYIGIYPILYTLDNHYLRDIVFLDRMFGGLLTGGDIRVDIFLLDFLSFYGGYRLRYIEMVHGSSSFKESGVWYTAINGGSGMVSFSDGFFVGLEINF
ncbi:omptin family outer membrane protease [Spirochaetia bacterium 38H-sp]|uniref:Omptin family outer membrane protease n=1 Tax=Rarispira pelagica TaxID=3141764 RepID=A0ABU9UAF5_9SPIR